VDDIDDRTNALKKMPLLSDLPHGELQSIAKRLKIELRSGRGHHPPGHQRLVGVLRPQRKV
jgi:hypothetical protein